MSDNLSYLSGRKGLSDNLFENYVAEAEETGTVEREKLSELANDFLIGDANTFGATSFYDFLKEENKGKKVYVCNGSACLCAGTQKKLVENLSTHFKPEEIGEMCCLGRCHENGAFNYEGNNYSAKTSEEIDSIIKNKTAAVDNYYVGSNCDEPILTSEFVGVEQYYQSLWEALKKSPDELLEDYKSSGLRGRGGAGFPKSYKLEAVKNAKGDQKFIVCNADEGDPGAYSDRWLLEERPHSVLFGMILAGYIGGADKGVLYIRAEYPESVRITEVAVQDLRERGYLGENIQGSGFNFDFKVIKAAGAYVCGEETALLSSIEGQRPEVRVRPPFPAQQGLFNCPTLVNNVETFASVHYIVTEGGEAYGRRGRGRSTGTKLVCLDSFFNRPGMYEVEMGTPLSEVINDLGQGFKSPVKALHVGGPLGGIVPASHFDKLTVDFESFAENGFLLGHAGVLSVPESFPMVKYLEHLFEFTSVESCGKCFPCRLGAKRGWEMLEKAQKDGYKIERQLMDDLLETMEDGSLCALGGGLPLGIKNAMQYFEEELNEYFA
ncbi:MAG: formate dehydrogenase [Crocinitomicaceae bacterium]|nr:formate dehydrogenase [Crocinitomicaceae bacterium]|tara:strand:- start:6274 stop:7926 length:1653 start_codon:yes stop_codon:yes gene_type:complete